MGQVVSHGDDIKHGAEQEKYLQWKSTRTERSENLMISDDLSNYDWENNLIPINSKNNF